MDGGEAQQYQKPQALRPFNMAPDFDDFDQHDHFLNYTTDHESPMLSLPSQIHSPTLANDIDQSFPSDIDWVSLLSSGTLNFEELMYNSPPQSDTLPTNATDTSSSPNRRPDGSMLTPPPGTDGGARRSTGITAGGGCVSNRGMSSSSTMRGCGGLSSGKSGKKSSIPPRFAFHTRSEEDVLDDGYKWRKYGQKAVKNSKHPRSYYRCTYHTCNVKKQIQRLARDTSIVVTTYEGIHNHPCEKLMETLTPLIKQLQFLSRF